jgi:hypothetical protein
VNQNPIAASASGTMRSCRKSQAVLSPKPVRAHTLLRKGGRLSGSFSCSAAWISLPSATSTTIRRDPVRVYLPEEELDTPVVLCSELPTNECTSMTKAAEQLPAEIIRCEEDDRRR